MKKKLTMILIFLIFISFMPSVFASESTTDSPISEEPVWTMEYEENATVRYHPAPNGNLLIRHGKELDLVNEDGDEFWTSKFSNNLRGRPTVKNGKLYVFSEARINNEKVYFLNCLDMEDGSKIWDKALTHWSLHILVNDDGEIFTPHAFSGNITKISSDQEVMWEKKFSDSILGFTKAFILDGKLYATTVSSTSKILCISSEGEVEWQYEFENEIIRLQEPEKEANELHAYTSRTIYEITKDGYKKEIYQVEEAERLTNLIYHEGKYYFTTEEKEGNDTHLKSISEEGEINWESNLNLVNTSHSYLRVGLAENERIYCQYQNTTKDFLNVYKIQAFDLNGELMWEHEYGNETSRGHHSITKSGLIITSDGEGRVLAYQGKKVEEKSENGGDSPHLNILLTVAVIMTVALLYHKRKR